jgi:hypothetical protein
MLGGTASPYSLLRIGGNTDGGHVMPADLDADSIGPVDVAVIYSSVAT